MRKTKILKKAGDPWFFFLPLALAIFGLIMIFNASSVAALRDFGDRFYYLKHQAAWFSFGLFLFFLFSFFDYRLLKKFAFPALAISLFLLVLVLIPGLGMEVYGGRRWLQLGTFRFQPAELTKLSLIVYLSSFLERKKEFLPFAAVLAAILGLLMLEPDLGTSVLIGATAVSLYFFAGVPLKNLGILAAAAGIFGPLLILLSPYRKQRLMTFLNSSFDAQGASYHVRQILIALGSGGIFGRGLGHSRQKFLFLPEVTTDSIFAIIAEEFGFIGAAVLIFLFFVLLYRGFKLVPKIEDFFGKMLVVGIISFIGFQAVVNLGAMVALLPLTGVPLPFISYGGSSLLTCLAGMGIVYNISKTANLGSLK